MDISSSRADPKAVAVRLSTVDAPIYAKLHHVLACLVSAVIALAVAAVMADGNSVIVLKSVEDLPIVTNPSLKSIGFDHRLDELLGQTYGIGLHHDQSGRSWDNNGAESPLSELIKNLGLPVIAAALPSVIASDSLKHPVPLLECNELKASGMAAMSLGFIAESVAVLMVLFHALSLAGLLPSKIAKPLAALVWLVLSVGFLTVILLAIGIFYATWECKNEIIPSIVISEHFNYSYGFAFAIIGYIAASLIFVTTVFCTSTTDDETDKHAAPEPLGQLIMKVVGGATAGLAVGSFAIIIVMASNGAFDDPAPVDPTINPCQGQKPKDAGPGDHYFSNVDCMKDNVVQVLEQAGANVTRGYKGLLDAGDRVPITSTYDQTDLCPVNVHWHLGAEHLSVGQFDGNGKGPVDGGSSHGGDSSARRQLAGSDTRLGHRCHHYDAADPKFADTYTWESCTNMMVGETYEIHWPHSAAGACGTQWQMQSPFYDGVFCNDGIITIAPLNTYQKIGVQSQTFTVINDEAYYYPDLFKGMIVDPATNKGTDMAKYTGSTTGTSRDNEKCSRYTPITWQVDRTCHLISASSFDKLCKDMLANPDDMSSDVYPHGSRITTADRITANNQQSRK